MCQAAARKQPGTPSLAVRVQHLFRPVSVAKERGFYELCSVPASVRPEFKSFRWTHQTVKTWAEKTPNPKALRKAVHQKIPPLA